MRKKSPPPPGCKRSWGGRSKNNKVVLGGGESTREAKTHDAVLKGKLIITGARTEREVKVLGGISRC